MSQKPVKEHPSCWIEITIGGEFMSPDNITQASESHRREWTDTADPGREEVEEFVERVFAAHYPGFMACNEEK